VTSGDGAVFHYPIYFKDPTPGFDKVRDARPQTEEERLTWGLRNPKCEYWTGGHNCVEFLTQPTKMAFDLVLSPVRVVVNPPWNHEVSPDNFPYRGALMDGVDLANPQEGAFDQWSTKPFHIPKSPANQPAGYKVTSAATTTTQPACDTECQQDEKK
jgi:hypothetical protein